MIANSKPAITMLFPYRWLTDDREFLGANLKKKIESYMGESMPMLRGVGTYIVKLEQQGYKPVKIEMSPGSMQKILKPVFPNGKCIDVETLFVQAKSRTMLPMINCEIYF